VRLLNCVGMNLNGLCQEFVHRAGIGDLQKAAAHIVVQWAFQGNLAGDLVARFASAWRAQGQFNVYALQRPHFALGVHAQGNGRARAQA